MFNKTEAFIRKAIRIWWLKQIIYLIILGILLFFSAQTIQWHAAWFYLILTACLTFANAAVMCTDLMIERSKFQISTRKLDKWLYALIYFWGPIAVLVTAGLEHRISSHAFIPIWLQLIAYFIMLFGGLLITWTFYVNPFYTSTMRIQYEREHRLISHGPYKVIRHPGYLGSICVILATPVALGSIYALILSFGVILGIVLRTYIEDVLLTRQFKGYYNYTKNVRFKLFPKIW